MGGAGNRLRVDRRAVPGDRIAGALVQAHGKWSRRSPAGGSSARGSKNPPLATESSGTMGVPNQSRASGRLKRSGRWYQMFKRYVRRWRQSVSAILVPVMIWTSVLLHGCNWWPFFPPVPSVEVLESTTSSTGQVEFLSQVANARVRVMVEDYDANPLGGIWVKMVADRHQIIIIALDQQGRYLPAVSVVEDVSFPTSLEPKIVPLKIVGVVMLAIAAVSLIHEMVTDPPRIAVVETGEGRHKKCFVGDVNDLIAFLGLVGPLSAGKIVAFKYGPRIGQVVEVAIGAGALVTDVIGKLSSFMGRERTLICGNEVITGPDGKPVYVEVGPIEANPVTELPSGVETELIATGEWRGHVADLWVRNRTHQTQLILLYPGIAFRNVTSFDRQDVTLIKTVSRALAPREETRIPVRGACLHLHKPPPRSGDRFVPDVEQRPDMVALGRAIDRFNPDESVAQEAIWVITDNDPPSSHNRREVRRLFILAGLNPDNYAALRGTSAWPAEKLRKMGF